MAAMGDMTATGEVVPPPMEAPSTTAVEADTIPFDLYTDELLRIERNVEKSGAQSDKLYKILLNLDDNIDRLKVTIEQHRSELKDEEAKRELIRQDRQHMRSLLYRGCAEYVLAVKRRKSEICAVEGTEPAAETTDSQASQPINWTFDCGRVRKSG